MVLVFYMKLKWSKMIQDGPSYSQMFLDIVVDVDVDIDIDVDVPRYS